MITTTLGTKLEDEFVSPLTAIRGVLEILRDFPDLPSTDRQQFIRNALAECARIEKGVEHLAATVYAAGERADLRSSEGRLNKNLKKFDSRIQLMEDQSIVEVDFSNFEFSSSKLVNEFYDEMEELIEESGRDWYFMVNYHNCSIWPEAWVAFAHRGRKINVGYSLGTVRFAQTEADGERAQIKSRDPDMFESRGQALAQIENLRQQSDVNGS